jgi:hypothetical protein
MSGTYGIGLFSLDQLQLLVWGPILSAKTNTKSIIAGRMLRIFVVVLLGSVAFGVSIGAAYSMISSPSSSSDAASPANTFGKGAHARPITIPATTSSMSKAAQVGLAKKVLATSGVTRSMDLASTGSGDNEDTLMAMNLPSGEQCLTVSYNAGSAVEQPNCASDAYLRVWIEESGASSDTAASARVIAVAATEVKTVRINLSDGSSHTLQPDGNGVVTFATGESEGLPVKIEALAADGSSLASASY